MTVANGKSATSLPHDDSGLNFNDDCFVPNSKKSENGVFSFEKSPDGDNICCYCNHEWKSLVPSENPSNAIGIGGNLPNENNHRLERSFNPVCKECLASKTGPVIQGEKICACCFGRLEVMSASDSDHCLLSAKNGLIRKDKNGTSDFTQENDIGSRENGQVSLSQMRRRNVTNGALKNVSDSHGDQDLDIQEQDMFNPDFEENGGPSSLCKSCEAENLKVKKDSSHEHSGLLSRSRYFLEQSLSNCVPDWWTEPEYMVHAKPRVDKTLVHHHADSLFSTDSGFTNYYGILNLCLILLVLGNARLFLENIIKYGILINFAFVEFLFFDPYNWPNLLLTCSLAIYPTIALLTEILLAKSFFSFRTGCIIYTVNLSCLLIIPAAVIYYLHPIIAFSLVTLGSTTICFLKLISYGHTNYWCREQRFSFNKQKRRKSCSSPGIEQTKNLSTPREVLQVYPDNLNVQDMAYFLFSPTLCYELNFPRSARIRKRFLLKRILEMTFLSWLCLGLMQQWIVPAVQNARQPLAEMEIFKMMERLLKLSIPNHFIWLIFFYWFFHSSLNVIAELLRFGDREFYKDWWNAESVSEFWKNWNIPVHRFATRHVYKPLLRKGVSKAKAAVIVFLLSAFFHEYLVSVPLRMFKIWAFSGMLLQVPIAYITGRFLRGKWGNIAMWISLILGQPVAILAYFHDYYIVGAGSFVSVNTTSSNGL